MGALCEVETSDGVDGRIVRLVKMAKQIVSELQSAERVYNKAFVQHFPSVHVMATEAHYFWSHLMSEVEQLTTSKAAEGRQGAAFVLELYLAVRNLDLVLISRLPEE